MKKEARQKLNYLVGFAGIVAVVILGIKYIFPYVAPFILAFLIAVGLEKKVKVLSRHTRGSRGVAATLIIVAAALALFALAGCVGFFAIRELQSLMNNYEFYWTMCCKRCQEICSNFDAWFGMRSGVSYEMVCKSMGEIENRFRDGGVSVVVGNAFPVITKWCVKTGLFLAGLLITFLSVIFISKDMYRIRDWRRKTVFAAEIGVIWTALTRLGKIYFRSQLIIIGCNSVICTLGLFLIQNPYALVIGISIGVLDALPLFGTGTVLLPWSIICVLEGRFYNAVVLIVIYAVTYFLREVLESHLIGDALSISPVTMLASIYVGMLVYGFWGFVLGPVSLTLIKAGTELLKSSMEHVKMNSV